MTQYQSFPDATGSSKSLEKLQALRLPPLAGKSFLDVGCNEGFFCGFAQHEGATKVVGIDGNQTCIDRAKQRFPDLSFQQQSWDDPIEGEFDVILLASALHYAKDQAGLIQKLVNQLTPTGTLVLELGVATAPSNEWITVKRSIDERRFPTRAKLAEILDPYAWKVMGNSVAQAGDPTPRLVVHIQRRRPYAFLLMAPPGSGKSTITRFLATAKDLTVISGDAVINEINMGNHTISDQMRAIATKNYCNTQIAPIIENIFARGFGSELVKLWLSLAQRQNVIIDAFVPMKHWEDVMQAVKQENYIPIELSWARIGAHLSDRESYAERTVNYLAALDSTQKKHSITGRILSALTTKPRQAANSTNPFQFDTNALPDDFDETKYLELHTDVARSGLPAGYHYLNHGKQEGRRYK